MSEIEDAASRLRAALMQAQRGLVDREVLVELVVLAAVAGEHILVVGPPGTAKSAAVRRIATRLGGTYFEYLLGRFTEPSEVFGPIDLHKLREGTVETATAGMLPEADIAFLDEVFLGSTAILNTLLGVLNERVFVRGHTRRRCPLRVCVGATNRIPEDEHLAAFADRFLVRIHLDSIGDSRLEDLLASGWQLDGEELDACCCELPHLDLLARTARTLDLGPVRPLFAEAIRELRSQGIELSDRRCVRTQRLIAAAALLDGRVTACEADLWPVVFAVPGQELQAQAREVLRKHLEASRSGVLAHAALASSLGPLARVEPILRAGEALFGGETGIDDAVRGQRLEGLAREIDATFDPKSMPEPISGLRARIVAFLGESQRATA